MTASTTDTDRAQDQRFVPERLLTRDLGSGRVLRLAAPSEFDEVGRVLQSAFTTGCWVTEFYREHLAAIAGRAVTANVWVVADDQGVLGAVLTPKPQYLRSADFTFNILGVGPRGRGLGLGVTLVDHCVALARAWGYPVIEIHSGPTMTAAHALYYRYGFVRRIERETAVVDSGQRLLVFSYRITDPSPRPDIPAEDPPQVWTFADSLQEPDVNLLNHLPPGSHDAAGAFRPASPERLGPVTLDPSVGYRLVTSVDALRGRAALIARRLAGVEGQIEVVDHPEAISPRLVTAAGDLVSDDWRYLARSILGLSAAGQAYYATGEADQIDALDHLLQHDLVGGVEKAVFASADEVGRVAQRVLYARLGEVDLRLKTRRYLLGDHLTAADVSLFAVLLGFDLEYRAHLGWGAASLVDYPSLWAYARALLQQPEFAGDAELIAVGLRPDAAGRFADSWGTPAAVEGVTDLRAAWLDDDDRDPGAA